MYKKLALYLAIFAFGAASTWIIPKALNFSQDHHQFKDLVKKHHGSDQKNHIHDVVNMPGLQGKDTTEEEVNDLKDIFKNHRQITRTVENLADGIKTVTETRNDNLRDAVVRHVVGMVSRLEEKRDPRIIIQSPTLGILFKGSHVIKTEIKMTEFGVEVIQTSSDPNLVKALKTHAAEITDMVNRGMGSVHERMSK